MDVFHGSNAADLGKERDLDVKLSYFVRSITKSTNIIKASFAGESGRG